MAYSPWPEASFPENFSPQLLADRYSLSGISQRIVREKVQKSTVLQVSMNIFSLLGAALIYDDNRSSGAKAY